MISIGLLVDDTVDGLKWFVTVLELIENIRGGLR
jgi:hypothetical protein